MRCVVADDSMIMRSRVESYLVQMEHEVVGTADNAKEGYRLCQELQPDLAFFDVLMPPGDGKVAAIDVKNQKLAKLVVVLTSNSQDFIKKDLEANGVQMMMKPITQTRFTKRVNQWLQSLS